MNKYDNDGKRVAKAITSNIRFALRNKSKFENDLNASSSANVMTNDKIVRMFVSDFWSDSSDFMVKNDVLSGIDMLYKSEPCDDCGSGLTRLIANTLYSIRSTFTLENIRLTKGRFNFSNIISDELSAVVDVMSRDFSKNNLSISYNASGDNARLENSFARKQGYLVFASGCLDINKGNDVSFIVSNISKELKYMNFNFYGDISIHMSKYLGSGVQFIPKRKSENVQAELAARDSLITQDLFTPSSYFAQVVAANFNCVLNRTKDDFERNVRKYKGAIKAVSGLDSEVREHHMLTLHNVCVR
jgi:hypothetical protein